MYEIIYFVDTNVCGHSEPYTDLKQTSAVMHESHDLIEYLANRAVVWDLENNRVVKKISI